MILGAHVSIEGGVRNAPQNGITLGCDAIQIFSKNQRQWAAKPLSEDESRAYRAAYRDSGLRGALVHGSYLINCASPDSAMWKKSRDALVDEAERCELLGIPDLNLHPGAHMDAPRAQGIERMARALQDVLDRTEGSRVRLLLESMAGQGTTLGDRFEDLARIRELAGNDARIGYTLDTCHLVGAGFEIATPTGYEETMARADEHLGLKRVRAFHLNDSKTPRGSRLDRHANIGEGTLATAGFQPLMKDRRFAEIPMVLETPGGDEGYRADLKILRRLAA